jgi:transcription antitermination protein NusB
MTDDTQSAAARNRSKRKTGGGSAKARRKAARLAAVQALYQIDLTKAAVETVVGEFVNHRIGQDIDDVAFVAADPQLFADIVRGTSARKGEVDGLLSAALDPRFPLERLETLLRAILRAGGYELFGHVDTAPRILISEYVDVAKAFFAGREPGMVNAVLDNVARVLRPDDMNSTDGGERADD